MDKSEAIVSVDDAIRKLVQLSSKEKIWTQEMLLQVNDKSLRLLDMESQVGPLCPGGGGARAKGGPAGPAARGPESREPAPGVRLPCGVCPPAAQSRAWLGQGVCVQELWPLPRGVRVCVHTWATSLLCACK